MLYIPYKGKTLHSRQKVYWAVHTTVIYEEPVKQKVIGKVYIINRKRQKTMSVKSDVQNFTISLLSPEDWGPWEFYRTLNLPYCLYFPDDWNAKWIGRDYSDDVLTGKTRLAARYLRKDFNINNKVISAKLYISGLGQYSVYINGKEVAAEEILKPALSDYRKRVYFNTYDVTNFVRKGDNAIGVVLEGGRYTAMRYNPDNPDRDGIKNILHFGTPRLKMQLEITCSYLLGGSTIVMSDTSWKVTNRGPIRTSNEFDGETHNANMDLGDWTMPNYDDSEWQNVELMEAPSGALEPQPNPNIMVQDRLKTVAMFQKDGKWIIDMGQNMVGNVQIELRNQKRGDTVTLRFAEILLPDSNVCMATMRAAECTDRYVSDGKPAKWHPMFATHGFRYVEVSGLRGKPSLSDFEGRVFYDKMSVTGTFATSNEIINSVYRNAYWGIRGNYRSMPTDCPQRDERMGWNGDRTTGCYGESYIFDNHHLYSKWITDADDSQLESGSLPDVMPAYWRFYSNSMTWPGAFITSADMVYTRFGDAKPIERHYPAMKKWLKFMKDTYMQDGIMTKDRYGDWCLPPESPELIHSRDSSRITAAPMLANPFYCHLCGKMVEFAKLLGKTDDAEYFQNEIQNATEAFNKKYFDTATGNYDNGTVTANILPLAFGMVPKGYERTVFDNIVNKTQKDHSCHVSTGVVGIQQLMRTLTDYGAGDLALKIATNEDYPSWGYMVRNGATTIWELWNGNTANPAMNSGNHVMLLGDLILWEYEYLAGIRPAEPGYSKIVIKPHVIDGLKSVNCSYQSPSGLIESSWTNNNGKFTLTVVIPPNTTASIYLPYSDGEGNQRIENVGSGKYKYTYQILKTRGRKHRNTLKNCP
jgi:alpha-L-rhamnosidase